VNEREGSVQSYDAPTEELFAAAAATGKLFFFCDGLQKL
jgi:hypothetical protein